MIRHDPVHVNLVEQEGWEKYDPASGKFDWIMDSAWQDFRSMDYGTLRGLVDDLWTVSVKGLRKPRVQLSIEELEYLAGRLKNHHHDDDMESVQRPIVDAIQWMYEAAVTPNDGDVESAMEHAEEQFKANPEMYDPLWEPVLLLVREIPKGPKEWAPRAPRVGRVTEDQLLDQLLSTISFEHEKDQWDRYLVFDFWSAPAAVELLKRDPKAEEELDAEFRNIRLNYVRDFFKGLEKTMKDINIENRSDWKKAWKSMISDRSVVSEARASIRKALREMPDEADES